MAEPRIGLALSGGGSKGAFLVGALKVLRVKFGEDYRVISGTSTGSLVASLLCTNQFAKLVKIYSTVKTSDLICPNHALVAKIAGPEAVLFASAVLGGRAIFDTTKLREVVDREIDFAKIKQVRDKTRVIFNAVNLQTGAIEMINNRDHTPEQLREGLLASSNMPVLTDPVPMNLGSGTQQLVDGGVCEYLPLRAVFKADVDLDHIFAITTAPIEPKRGKPEYDAITDILARTIDLLDTEVGSDDLEGARLYNSLLRVVENATNEDLPPKKVLAGVDPAIRKSLSGKRSIPITLIAPSKHLAMDSLEFDPTAMKQAMKHGVDRAKKVTQGLSLA